VKAVRYCSPCPLARPAPSSLCYCRGAQLVHQVAKLPNCVLDNRKAIIIIEALQDTIVMLLLAFRSADILV
jgi:hypothetical protein